MKTKVLRKIIYWLPPILWSILIFRFSSGRIPVTSSVYWQDFAVKKTGHVLLFGILAVLLYRSFLGEGLTKKKAVITAIILASLYGVSDEFHQIFTQGREARIRDVFIDTAGATVFGYAVYYWLPRMPKEIKMLGERIGIL